MFSIYGENTDCELHYSETSNGCVMWADRYTRRGDFGGWKWLELREHNFDGTVSLVSTLRPADEFEPATWEDAL